MARGRAGRPASSSRAARARSQAPACCAPRAGVGGCRLAVQWHARPNCGGYNSSSPYHTRDHPHCSLPTRQRRPAAPRPSLLVAGARQNRDDGLLSRCSTMCFGDELKFCSCDADELSPAEIGWVLKLVDPNKETRSKKGKCLPPPPSSDEELSIEKELNIRNCFDFELEPGAMYQLAVRLPQGNSNEAVDLPAAPGGRRWQKFVRKADGTWRHDRGSKFAAWRQQLVPQGSGMLFSAELASALQRLAYAAAFARKPNLALPGGLAASLVQMDLPSIQLRSKDGNLGCELEVLPLEGVFALPSTPPTGITTRTAKQGWMWRDFQLRAPVSTTCLSQALSVLLLPRAFDS
eukprot:SAG31_NODE_297_length_18175_cov_68.266659_7_plen_349_part_00